MTTAILVTGGAGYIGSHVVRRLTRAGYHVIVVDDLSKGFREAVIDADLIVGDFGDGNLIKSLIAKHDVKAVMHFAALTVVPESVSAPLKYYANNTVKAHALISSCMGTSVRHFVFSSTAAVYGAPESAAVSEEMLTRPINPYGSSKLMTEWILKDTAATGALNHVTLRYFNVAGGDPQGRIGQSTPQATLLIKVACEAAAGKRDSVTIFGTDYPTPDGTGVRDYIHVEDLARAHLKALTYLENKGESVTLNCGYGHGHSVREVLDAVEHVADTRLDIREAPRRPGDPPILIARAKRIKDLLGWSAEYDDLQTIVAHSLNWERNRRY